MQSPANVGKVGRVWRRALQGCSLENTRSIPVLEHCGEEQGKQLTFSNQSRVTMGMPRAKAHKNLTVRRTRSVTRWVQLKMDSAKDPPSSLTTRSPSSSITPVKSTYGEEGERKSFSKYIHHHLLYFVRFYSTLPQRSSEPCTQLPPTHIYPDCNLVM